MSIAILLIESEAHQAQAMTRSVADQGLAWHVEHVAGVAQARAALADGVFDVVLVRHELADGSAFDLHDAFKDRPAILCIHPGQEALAARALQAGFADYLVIDPAGGYLQVLAERIKTVITHAQNALRLRDVTARLDLALAHADLGWWDRRVDDGALALSDRACAMLGYAQGEVHWTVDEWRQRVHPQDLEVAEGRDPQQLHGSIAVFHAEYRLRHKQGHWVWVLSHGRVMQFDREGQPLRVFGTVMDISHLRKSEESLRQAAALLEQKTQLLEVCFSSVSQGILQIAPDGTVINYNERLCELLDLPRDWMATKPNMREIFKLQQQRGDFGAEYRLAVSGVRRQLAAEYQRGSLSRTDLPQEYWRKTHDGRFLEVKTRSLSDGGWVRTFADVTPYFEAKQALSQSEERFRSLTALSSDWYWELDEHYRFVRFDGYDEQKAGLPMKDVIGMTRWELGALNMGDADWEAHRATLDAHQSFRNLELNRIDSNGQSYWISLSGLPIFDADGVFRGYRGVGQNITERKHAEKATETLAFYDPLTGLPNRRLMLNRLGKALESAARHRTQGALLFIDLDNFKLLNDTKGHDTGDALLRQVGQRLSDCVRAIDTVSRLGGDEFVIMLEGLHPDPEQARDQAQAVGDKVLAAFHTPFQVGEHLHTSSPSIGITLFGEQQRGVEELLKQADLAMYQSKSAGRNTFRFFDPDMQVAVSERAQIEADLRLALQQGQLLLHFQPVVDEVANLRGVEALARWQHPRRGLVLPGDFIGVAEHCGLILPLGQLVLQMACARLAEWARDERTAHLYVAVNVSARQLRQNDFVPLVLNTLAHTRAPANRLRLELTESMLLSDVEDTIEKLRVLRAHGVGFSLDDFGTGYSSLSYLKRLPLDQIKIDHSFVRDVLTDPNDASIACTIVTLARCLGLTVVAEGVESEGQKDFLLSHGCRVFQGYLFGRPVPEDALLRSLATQATESPSVA